MNDDKFLDISWKTIFKIAVASLGFYIIYLVRDILIWFIFSLIISILFEPALDFLRRFRLSRPLAVFFVYAVVFGVLGITIYLSAPVFVSEIQQFSQLFPQYFEKIAPPLRGLGVEAFESMENFTQSVGNFLQKASADILSALAIIFGSIGSTLFILTISIFLSLEKKGMEKILAAFSPKKYEDQILSLWERSRSKVAGWFGTRILACLFVGVTFFIALALFKVKYAFAFALLSGVLNFIPILGPVISGAMVAVFVALDSWVKAIFVLIVFTLIQQIEGNILTPILTRRIIGLPPVLVLISLAIGGKLLGILGAILAIPLAGVIYEFLKEFLAKRKEADLPQPEPAAKKPIIW